METSFFTTVSVWSVGRMAIGQGLGIFCRKFLESAFFWNLNMHLHEYY
jgi:hypothetical protein